MSGSMVMLRFITSVVLASALLTVAQQSIVAAAAAAAAPSEAEEFWATVLPDYPLPDALLWYIHPETNLESTVEATGAGDDGSSGDNADIAQRLSRQWPFYYWTYGKKGYSLPKPAPAADDMVERLSRQWPFYYWTYEKKGSSSQKPAPAADDMVERLSRQWPFYYWTYEKQGSPSLHKYATTSSGNEEGHSHVLARGHKAKMNMSAVFFHEEAVRVGKSLPFYFPPARRAPLGMLPRSLADSIPFSTQTLLDILALLGVAVDSAEAADMEKTLSMCEALSPSGEPKFCATSLEAQIEGARTVLGGHDIHPLTSRLPRFGAPWQPYVIRAVRPEVGSRFVSCHDVVYLYTVYRCHDTGPARLYTVEMEGARGGGVFEVAVVCHTDTSQWDPKHLAFKLLGTKPGGPPVCHVMPYGHIVWATNDGGRSS